MLVSDAQSYTTLLAYLTITSAVITIAIAYIWNDPDFEDEKSMSSVIFIVIAFVEILSSILMLGIWQQQKMPNRRMKEIQCSIVIGGLLIFMGIFFIEDGYRRFTYGELSKTGEFLRVLESSFCSISGILLGGFKHYFGHKLKSFVLVADSLICICSGITTLVSLTVLYYNSVDWAQRLARFCAALFTIYCGLMVIGHANSHMITIKQQEMQQARQLELRSEKLQFEDDLYDDEESEISSDDTMFLFNWTLLKSIMTWPVECCSYCFKMNARRDMYTSLTTEDSDLVDDRNDISFNSK